MFKILFADDEPFVIEGLKIMIDWKGLGIEIVGEASDGDTAFELIKKLSPDIVISDICMPGMSGTELLEKCSDFRKKPEFIMLTGYGDMDYIRTSMKYGAKGYLLKPLDPEEVTKTIGEVCTSIAEQRAKQAEADELFNLVSADAFWRVFSGNTSQEVFDKCRFLLGLKRDVPLMLIGCRIAGNAPRGIDDPCFKKILSVTPKENTCIFAVGYRHIFVVNANTDHELNMTIAESAIADCTGVSMIRTENMAELSKAYFSVMRSFAQIEEGVKVVRFIKNESLFPTVSGAEHVIGMAAQGHANAAREKLKSDMEKIRISRMGFDFMRGYAVSMLIHMDWYASMAQLNIGCTLEDALTALSNAYDYDITEALCEEFLDIFLNSIGNANDLSSISIGEKIVDYIKKNYKSDLTLAKLSRELEISTSTISKAVKQNTGMKFSDYINFVRIQNAKKMLRYSNAKITSIAAESGYNDYYYFASKFKDMTGELPSDYRKKKRVWVESVKITQPN